MHYKLIKTVEKKNLQPYPFQREIKCLIREKIRINESICQTIHHQFTKFQFLRPFAKIIGECNVCIFKHWTEIVVLFTNLFFAQILHGGRVSFLGKKKILNSK